MSFEYVKRGTFYPVEIEGRGFTAVCIAAPSNVRDSEGRLCFSDCRISGVFKTLGEMRAALEAEADQGLIQMLSGGTAVKFARFRIFVKAEQAADFLSAERIEFVPYAKVVCAAGEVFGRKGMRRYKEYNVYADDRWIDRYPTLEKAKAAARRMMDAAPLGGVWIREYVSVSTGEGAHGRIAARRYDSQDGRVWAEAVIG